MAKKLFGPDYQPAKRGQDKRTLILEALKQSGRLSLSEDATNSEVERAWFAKIAEVALDDEHKDSGMCKQALLDRGWAKAKPESNPTPFDFDVNATPKENANKIMLNASEGDIPTEDMGKIMAALKDIIAIEEHTDLVERVKELESKLRS